MAEEAKKRLHLTEVWLLINPHNPHKNKQDIADFKNRAGLCEILAQKNPWLKVSYFEEKMPSAYTAETLKNIKKCYKNSKFIWLMGSDNMPNFHKWKDWHEILETTPVVIFSREEENHNKNNTKELNSPAFNAYSKYRVNAKTGLNNIPQWRILFTRTHKGRATEIRGILANKNASSPHLTPAQLKSSYLKDGYRGDVYH